MVQEVMPMPRGMIAAPPMPQYGMPMNGQMPPHPPMMPPMPPMPPQPPQQQGAQPQGAPPQVDPWAGGINPSLTALLPQGGAPGYGQPVAPAHAYSPAPYPQPSPAPWAPPPAAALGSAPVSATGALVQPAPAALTQPATAMPGQNVVAAQAEPPPVAQVQPTPASPPVQPTPIARPVWAWPPATIGVPIEPQALVGAPVRPATPIDPAVQELLSGVATLHPWRNQATPATDPTVSPWDQVNRAPAIPPNLSVEALAVPPNPWRPAAPSPWDLAGAFTPEPLPPALPLQAAIPAPLHSVLQPEQSLGLVKAASAEGAEPTAQPYYPTLAPANAPQPIAPDQPLPAPPAVDGTYSTRSGRYARKSL